MAVRPTLPGTAGSMGGNALAPKMTATPTKGSRTAIAPAMTPMKPPRKGGFAPPKQRIGPMVLSPSRQGAGVARTAKIPAKPRVR